MPSAPMYLRHPLLYSFNKTTQRHMLKSNKAYKKAFAANPDNFVESSAMLELDIAPSAVAVPSVLEPTPQLLLPVDPVSPPMDDQKAIEKQRQLITALIKQELAQNLKPYEGKPSQDLDVLFRQLLVAKLLKSNEAKQPTINKSTKSIKLATTKSQTKFKIVPAHLESEEDQDVTDEDEEE